MVKSVAELVRQMEQNDNQGQTTFSKYVSFSMREDIEKTEAYINSKHISGDTDYMGREKPFFNIVSAARNIWFRATDLDRKNIIIRASKEKEEIYAFLSTILLQEWMKKANFGQILNDWGLTLATHGSAVLKFIEKNSKLFSKVMDWNNLIVDPVDFENNPVIEKFWLTPAQLKKSNYDKEIVDKLLDSLTTRKTADGQKKDNKSDYIPIYEIHGEMPLSYLTGNEDDEDEYVQQMHVISFQAVRESNGGWEEYTLYSGKEVKNPYFLTHLLKKDGQTYAGGAVKNLFEAQWMVNDNAKKIKDQLDLASKIIFQTSDGAFVGQNVLANIENGRILIHQMGQPLTMLNNKPDIAAMQAFKNDWQILANQINGISESMMGENPPSGTAWRLQQLITQESNSLFEMMTENKGLALIEMMRKYIIPYFKKQLNNTDEISAILDENQIKEIDSRYLPNEVNRVVNKKKKETILSGRIYDTGMESQEMAQADKILRESLKGVQRFIKPSEVKSKTWKEVVGDMEWKLDIDITGEAKDIQAIMATLSTVFQTVASNPMILQDPNAKMIFNKILNLTKAVSPLEIQSAQTQPAPAMMGASVGDV